MTRIRRGLLDLWFRPKAGLPKELWRCRRRGEVCALTFQARGSGLTGYLVQGLLWSAWAPMALASASDMYLPSLVLP